MRSQDYLAMRVDGRLTFAAVAGGQPQLPDQMAGSVGLEGMFNLIYQNYCTIWHNGLLNRQRKEPSCAKARRTKRN